MSSEDTYAVIRRERETEKKIRAMDAADIVELVHGLEDEIERHEMASDMLRAQVRVLREALERISFECSDDLSERAKRFIDSVLATTAPEGGEV